MIVDSDTFIGEGGIIPNEKIEFKILRRLLEFGEENHYKLLTSHNNYLRTNTYRICNFDKFENISAGNC